MKTNKLYKHKNCRDVVFGPTSILIGDKGLLVTGRWYNVAYTKVLALDVDTICIDADQLDNWKEYV